MIAESKIKNSFANVRKDIDLLKYTALSNIRYLNMKVKEQGIRIVELERRLAQVERLAFQNNIIG